MKITLIMLGGALGTGLRYALSQLSGTAPGTIPWGTFVANVVGSFLLGLLFVWADGRQLLGVDLRLVTGVGLLGGFTTYSSFNLEVLRFAESGQWTRAVMYALGTFAVCLLAGSVGLAVARWIR